MPNQRPAHCNGSHHQGSLTRRLRFEALEVRHLLSLSVAGYAVPDYLANIAPHGVSPLATSGPTGYTPAQIRQAYGFNNISFNNGAVAGDGSGTTIAIVDAYDDPKIANDLHQFDLQFGLPDPVLTKVNQNGGSSLPAANAGWITEIALDVEWAHAIAPKANILLVEAASSSFSNLLTAVNYARQAPGVVVVSMSWGGDEFSSENLFDSYFTTPSGHAGVTFVASSGDSGAPVSYPAVSPNVLSVGGTTLSLTAQGNYLSESGWSGSGGGISSFEVQPAYQQGTVTQTGTFRANPDVAYDANPSTGFPVYDSYNNPASAPWGQWGGTSDAAPQWAALIAIADQGRALSGQGPLDGATQTLPMLYATSAGGFHDITGGTSDGTPRYSAAAGYDLVTGRGSPVANLVVNNLVGVASATVAVTTPGLYDPGNSVFYLRSSNSGGFADSTIAYGPAGASPAWVPLAGDWSGTGTTTIGLYDPASSTFYLKNANTSGYADTVFSFAPAGVTVSWIPLVGDWTGSGVTTVGLYNPATATFYLKDSNSGGSADTVFSFAPAGANASWVPLVGDWTGSGVTTVGLYDPVNSTFYLKDSNSSGNADIAFTYGPADASPEWIPVAGNWTGSSVTTVGLYDPAASVFYLKNSNSGGYADTTFTYGAAGTGWTPIVGNWNLTGSSSQAATATSRLVPSPSLPSGSAPAAVIAAPIISSRGSATADDSFATVADATGALGDPAASQWQVRSNVTLTPDAWYLDAVLQGGMAHAASAEATGLWDTSGTDDGVDLLANAVAGQPLFTAVHSALSDSVRA
jgi:cell wall assembly regulator SMI1